MCTSSFETNLGVFVLCQDDRGICSISLPGTDPAAGKHRAVLSETTPVLESAKRQIAEYLAGARKTFDLPLSVNGTPFQQQVWKIIQSIPYGQRLSYGEIASRLGSKKKARAVGGAANANPLPLIVPCHRVVGADGSLTGFAGGIELKQYLLHLEQGHLQVP